MTEVKNYADSECIGTAEAVKIYSFKIGRNGELLDHIGDDLDRLDDDLDFDTTLDREPKSRAQKSTSSRRTTVFSTRT